MRRAWVGWLAYVLLAAAPVSAQGAGTLRGRVVNESTGEPLPLAVVEVLGTGRALVAPTDSIGTYVLRGVPSGRRVLRARQLGFSPFEMEVFVPTGGELMLEIALTPRPVALEPVNVQVTTVPRAKEDTLTIQAPELAMAGVRALESTPGLAELGLGESARGVPGQEPVDPSDVLYVRGAAADLKLVLLDGAPVYAPFHLGGLVPSFEPEVLGSARLYLGGAPARYDGGLSYVMDMNTRAARDGFHVVGALDLLSARTLVEGELGGVRVLAGGRGVHGFGSTSLLEGTPPYEYADGLVRLDVPTGGGAVSLMGFRNGEGLHFDSLRSGRDGMARWQNSATSLRYRGRLADTKTDLTAAFGSFDARLPINGRQPVLAEAAAQRLRLAADLTRGAGPVLMRYGASYDRTMLNYRVSTRLAERDSLRSASDVTGDAAGAYVDASWQPGARLHLRGGLRADVFSLDPVPVLAPRLTATWLLSDRAALTAAAGRYHQYVRPAERIYSPGDSTTADSIPAAAALSVAKGTHLSLGLDQELGEGIRLGIEGFYKRFDGLPAARSGGANASGMDLWVRRGSGRVTGWFGYSLAWVWSLDPGESATSNFIGRQLLSSGIAGPIGQRGRFDVRVAYGAGLPYTAIRAEAMAAGDFGTTAGFEAASRLSDNSREAPPLTPATPSDPYLRVDVDLSHTWTPEWRGGRFAIKPYLRVLNALDRRDALFYRYDEDGDAGPSAVAPLPVLPVLGVEWRF
jgi:hypothetical protein